MAEEKVKAGCPRCGKRVQYEGNPQRPFCSQRCKLIDLGKWIEGEYRISGEIPTLEEKGRGDGSKLPS
jgi:endogenous inhibitor of DNA gyrase (YacG/DUF329 family)